MADPIQRLGLYEPKDILPLASRTGTGRQPLQLMGNSLLSLLFVKNVGAGVSVSVKYYDSGSGTDQGEYNLVGEHPAQAAAPATSRILVTRHTNKGVLDWTVTGGTAEFGVYGYVVSSFASDLDNALQLQGTITDLLNDKGIVAMGYDSALNQFFFLPLKDGALVTTSETPGDPRLIAVATVTTPGSPQDLVNQAVPVTESWKLRQIEVVCRAYATFTVYADGAVVGSGRTGPDRTIAIVKPNPYHEIAAPKIIKVTFLETVGPVVDVECYVRATNH